MYINILKYLILTNYLVVILTSGDTKEEGVASFSIF